MARAEACPGGTTRENPLSFPVPYCGQRRPQGAVSGTKAKQSRDLGGQVQRTDSERHGMGMLTYTAGAQDHGTARQSSHMQMGGREQ